MLTSRTTSALDANDARMNATAPAFSISGSFSVLEANVTRKLTRSFYTIIGTEFSGVLNLAKF